MTKARWGQHFLIKESYLTLMLKAANIKKDELVLEIGPGKGVLTRKLITLSGRVVALEIDKELIKYLKNKLGDKENLTIYEGDVRSVVWSELFKELEKLGYAKIKLVANLPYYIATQLIIDLLRIKSGPEIIVVMVQDEVARRICAQPGSKDYSSYSIAIQYYGESKYITRVPPKAFWPPPKVFSGIVSITKHVQPLVEVISEQKFFYILNAIFTHRRKTLRNCLSGVTGVPPVKKWEEIIIAAQLDPKLRPQNLNIQDIAKLANLVEISQ